MSFIGGREPDDMKIMRKLCKDRGHAWGKVPRFAETNDRLVCRRCLAQADLPVTKTQSKEASNE